MNNFDSLYGDLTTYGRVSGKPHKVELTFAYADNKLYFLAHKGKTGKSTDWFHNLEHNPECLFTTAGREYKCKAVPLIEVKKIEEKIRDMFKTKGGKSHFDSWYANSERIPVVLEIISD